MIFENTNWAEELPENCPPPNALKPRDESFYRLVESSPPSDKDFYSHRKLFPKRKYRVNECRARSLSVHKDRKELEKIRKLPRHRKKMVIQLVLHSECGAILQTGRNKSHYSWWLAGNFNSLLNSISFAG